MKSQSVEMLLCMPLLLSLSLSLPLLLIDQSINQSSILFLYKEVLLCISYGARALNKPFWALRREAYNHHFVVLDRGCCYRYTSVIISSFKMGKQYQPPIVYNFVYRCAVFVVIYIKCVLAKLSHFSGTCGGRFPVMAVYFLLVLCILARPTVWLVRNIQPCCTLKCLGRLILFVHFVKIL